MQAQWWQGAVRPQRICTYLVLFRACHHHSAARARGLCTEPHGHGRSWRRSNGGWYQTALGSGVRCRPRTRSGVRHAGDAGDLIRPPARGPSRRFMRKRCLRCADTKAAIVLIDRSYQQLVDTLKEYGAALPKTGDPQNRAAGHRHQDAAGVRPVPRFDFGPPCLQRRNPDFERAR